MSLTLCRTVEGTDYFYLIPREDSLPPDGTTFAAYLVCRPSNPDRLRGSCEARRLIDELSSRETARGSDWPCVMTGRRVHGLSLYVFPMPLVPPDRTLCFVVPMVRLRFFPDNEDELPLSH